MQNADAIIRQPILIGLLLSIAAHAAMLNGRGIHTPAASTLQTGRTVVHLTLLPSISSSPIAMQPQRSDPFVEQAIQPETVSEAVAEVVAETVEAVEAAEATEAAEAASIDQDASLEEDKGVTAEAAAISAFHPTYPRVSRRRGEEGTVTLSVQVLPAGVAGRIEVIRSSGYRRLDQAAVDAAGKTRYEPALLFGRTVESNMELSYTFRLSDD